MQIDFFIGSLSKTGGTLKRLIEKAFALTIPKIDIQSVSIAILTKIKWVNYFKLMAFLLDTLNSLFCLGNQKRVCLEEY